MTDKYPSDSAAVRRRKLDELFADQPFLSATMMASRLHERLTDKLPSLPIPVTSCPSDDEVLVRLIEGRRRQTPGDVPVFAGSDIPPDAPRPVPAPARPARRPRIAAAAQTSDEGLTRLELLVDFHADPPQIRAVGKAASTDPDVMTVQETARFLRVSQKAVRGLVRQGHLACARLGRRMRFRREAVLAWLQTLERPSRQG